LNYIVIGVKKIKIFLNFFKFQCIMEEILHIYVHRTQTPESLSSATQTGAILSSEVIAELKEGCYIYMGLQIIHRSFQTDVPEGTAVANHGGYGYGPLERLTIHEQGAPAGQVADGIRQKVQEHYRGIQFPAAGLERLGQLFVFGIYYGTEAVHEGLFRAMDTSMADYNLVRLS
jgi:hypothetical protein